MLFVISEKLCICLSAFYKDGKHSGISFLCGRWFNLFEELAVSLLLRVSISSCSCHPTLTVEKKFSLSQAKLDWMCINILIVNSVALFK